MINKMILRWFLTVVLVFAFYIGLLIVEFGFSSNITYNYSIISDNDPVSVWRAFFDTLFDAHNTAMDYVILSVPILLVLLFIIHKKIR